MLSELSRSIGRAGYRPRLNDSKISNWLEDPQLFLIVSHFPGDLPEES
jgi:hypothetical protein